MIPEKAFGDLLEFDGRWEVCAATFDSAPTDRFLIEVKETKKLWPSLQCPVAACGGKKVVCHDHAQPRTWRHLDAFGKRAEILCALPRARCKQCEQVWTVKAPWEGTTKGFTKEFEAFSLKLMKEMPVKRAGEILGEQDTRLWRTLLAYVEVSHQQLDFSKLTAVAAHALSMHQGKNRLTVFTDLSNRRVVFATVRRGRAAVREFAVELQRHNGNPEAIQKLAIDMSAGEYDATALKNARIVHDPMHVSTLFGKAMDAVLRLETKNADVETKKTLKGVLSLLQQNPEALTRRQVTALERPDLQPLASAQAYQAWVQLNDIFRIKRNPAAVRSRLKLWIKLVRSNCLRWSSRLAPLKKVAQTVEKYFEGILAYWQGDPPATGFEGMSEVFEAVKRKARGYRSPAYLMAMLYFVAGGLTLPLYP
jgi:transposase